MPTVYRPVHFGSREIHERIPRAQLAKFLPELSGSQVLVRLRV